MFGRREAAPKRKIDSLNQPMLSQLFNNYFLGFNLISY